MLLTRPCHCTKSIQRSVADASYQRVSCTCDLGALGTSCGRVKVKILEFDAGSWQGPI